MKKLLLSLAASLMLFACSDDNSSSSNLSDTPTAKVAYDNNNYGIYKGVFVGSTGRITVNLNNDGQITATLVIDGKSYTYTTEDTTQENSYTSITFSLNNDSFDFEVESDGSNPIISNISISGHAGAAIQIIKEESDSQVYCYEGTFTEDGGGGTLNLVISDNQIYGLVLPGDGELLPHLTGTITNNSITGSIPDTATFTGTINGNNITGNWTSDTGSGTWKVSRKL